LTARRTTWTASFKLRSTSLMNCSAPPRSTSVHVRALGQPSNRLYRSAPIWRSSKTSHDPRCSSRMSLHVLWTAPPTALTTRLRSSVATRPAQKMWRSAKYWVARSPIGRRDRTTVAPELAMSSSLR